MPPEHGRSPIPSFAARLLALQHDLHFRQGTHRPRASPSREIVVNKRIVLNIGKYVLAAGLLVWVVRSNWAPPPDKGSRFSLPPPAPSD